MSNVLTGPQLKSLFDLVRRYTVFGSKAVVHLPASGDPEQVTASITYHEGDVVEVVWHDGPPRCWALKHDSLKEPSPGVVERTSEQELVMTTIREELQGAVEQADAQFRSGDQYATFSRRTVDQWREALLSEQFKDYAGHHEPEIRS